MRSCKRLAKIAPQSKSSRDDQVMLEWVEATREENAQTLARVIGELTEALETCLGSH